MVRSAQVATVARFATSLDALQATGRGAADRQDAKRSQSTGAAGLAMDTVMREKEHDVTSMCLGGRIQSGHRELSQSNAFRLSGGPILKICSTSR
jgi:hypothetical protein